MNSTKTKLSNFHISKKEILRRAKEETMSLEEIKEELGIPHNSTSARRRVKDYNV